MLKVKRVSMRRFLSVGDKPLVIDFAKLGPIVNIRGRNLDGGPGSSNGAGKSTVLEGLCFGLTGKLLKGLAHKDIVHRGCKGKGLVIDYEFDLNGEACRILRKLGPSQLEFWRGGKHYDLGVTETQREIDKAIGLTHEALLNIAFFGQHNRYAFLNCDAATKRKIVEALLGLEKYNARCQKVKDRRRDLEKEIQHNAKHFEQWHGQSRAAQARLARLRAQQADWRERKARELASAREGLAGAQRDFEGSDAGRAEQRWKEAQEEIAALVGKIAQRRGQLAAADGQIETAEAGREAKREDETAARVEVGRLEAELRQAEAKIAEHRGRLDEFGGLQGQAKCPTCHGKVDRQNFQHLIEHANNCLGNQQAARERAAADEKAARERLAAASKGVADLTAWLANAKAQRQSYAKSLAQMEAMEARLREVPPPAQDAAGNEARDRIAALKADVSRLEGEQAAGDPYGGMAAEAEADLRSAETETQEYRELIAEQEGLLPYLDYWVRGFGDDGIRSLLIGEVVAPLNSRVNYWLHFLMAGQARLTFDRKLNETITNVPPNGDPYVYAGMSGGQHQRIDIAISQAFGHLTAMTVGAGVPSFVCLDEVAANVDREGVQCIYRMITELARDRQVIVITHDPDLLELLAGNHTLWVEREGGVTQLAG